MPPKVFSTLKLILWQELSVKMSITDLWIINTVFCMTQKLDKRSSSEENDSMILSSLTSSECGLTQVHASTLKAVCIDEFR